jgi:hypothetical protein
MTKSRSNFSLVFNTPEWVLIRDNANETQTMSVTNDAENVVKFLKENALLFKDTILYYIDTDGRVDILEHDGNGKFIDFKAGFANEEEFFKARGH